MIATRSTCAASLLLLFSSLAIGSDAPPNLARPHQVLSQLVEGMPRGARQ
jgi:hypothetical protein